MSQFREFVCVQCGTPFHRYVSQVTRSNGGCCGRACAAKASAQTRTRPLAERFWAKVNKAGPAPAHRPELGACWLWIGSRDRRGYGWVGMGGKRGRVVHTHRVAWVLTHGALADRQPVLHHCDIRPCVRPDHLYLGTQADNMRDVAQRRRWGGPRNIPCGSASNFAKLTEAIVLDIRSRYAAGHVSMRQLGTEYGVTRNAVGDLIRRKTWQHI